MHLSLWFLYSLIVVLLVCLSVSIYYLLKFARIILEMEDALEVSLDLLDDRFKVMYNILQKPIFFDSLEVRQCVNEIKKTRSIILYIANILTDPVKKEELTNSLYTQINEKESLDGEKES